MLPRVRRPGCSLGCFLPLPCAAWQGQLLPRQAEAHYMSAVTTEQLQVRFILHTWKGWPCLIRSKSTHRKGPPPCALSPRPHSLLEQLVALSKSLPHCTSASPTQRKGGKGEAPTAREGDGSTSFPGAPLGFPSSAPEDTASLPSLCSLRPSRSHSHCAEISWLPRDLSETLDAMSHSQLLGHLC